MKENFRGEVFKLCNILLNNEKAKAIGSLIYDLSVSTENVQTGLTKHRLHGDFAYIAQHSNNQFQGYLFVDDNIDTLEFPIPFRVEHLSRDERILIEQGHRTLIRFIEMCLEEINKESKVVAEAINPYFLFKNVKCSPSVISILTDEEMSSAVKAFKEGSTYKALIDSKFEYFFEKIDRSALQALIGTTEKEINMSFGEEIPSDLRDFSVRFMRAHKDITDIMLAFTILMYSLKESLRIACQLLYEAICGVNLQVINNDNIINIENQTSNTFYKEYKVLIQGILMSHTGRSVGSILLMDCDPSDKVHLHEFGMITSMTQNFTMDMGETTKFTFITVNEELINIHNITNSIINTGLPKGVIR